MIIDWYTVIFQIVNFLILVFLLRYFLYGPIIRAMDERERKIVQREEEAAEQKEEAEKLAKAYLRKSGELKEQEEELKDKARAEAEKEKHDLLNKARREVDETRQRWEEAFEREKETFITELRRRIGQQACSVARRCLQDLADARLEELTWGLFLNKIAGLSAAESSALREALAEGGYRASLRTVFEIPAKNIKELEAVLRRVVNDRKEISLSAKTDPDLICGLELEAGGYRLAWNIENYLEDVEEQILRELEQTAHAENSGEVPGSGKTES